MRFKKSQNVIKSPLLRLNDTLSNTYCDIYVYLLILKLIVETPKTLCPYCSHVFVLSINIKQTNSHILFVLSYPIFNFSVLTKKESGDIRLLVPF